MDAETVAPLWDDAQPAFVLGGGPSVLQALGIPHNVRQAVVDGAGIDSMLPYFDVLQGKRVVGVNDAYLLGPGVLSALFIGDSTYAKMHAQELADLDVPKYTTNASVAEAIDAHFISPAQAAEGLTGDPSFIVWNRNSGLAAVNLAYHLGAREIVLLGIDMCAGPNGETHWSRQAEQAPPFSLHASAVPQVLADAKELGIQLGTVVDTGCGIPVWEGSLSAAKPKRSAVRRRE
jgi:hypothetical protein